jgi:hypothetical protein
MDYMVLLYAAFAALTALNVVYLVHRRRRRPPSSGEPMVSVMIPARNEAVNLARLLPSLLEQRYANLDIIVYDDASEDDTAAVVERFADPRITLVRGDGPPSGWVGKVHALYQATRVARGEVFLFLDADTRLRYSAALSDLVSEFQSLPAPRVLSGLTRLRGGGALLVSMIPLSLLAVFPVFLAPRGRRASLGVVNGQCWMIDRESYLRLEPHQTHRDAVLEDVMIGRYLKTNGAAAHVLDLQSFVEVFIYESLSDAWMGFRKNAYPLCGGTPLRFLALHLAYLVTFVVAPFTSLWALGGLLIVKGLTDRFAGFPVWVSLGAPLSTLLSGVLQLDSAVAHWTGRARWKGRVV